MSAGQRPKNSQSRRITGIGTPSNHNRSPRPIISSSECNRGENAQYGGRFQRAKDARAKERFCNSGISRPRYRQDVDFVRQCYCVRRTAPVSPGSDNRIYRAKSYPGVALSLRRMQLPQSDNGLAVALLIERDGGAEYAGIVVFVGAMIDLDQMRPVHTSELHPISDSVRSLGAIISYCSFAADANIDRLCLDPETGRTKPLREMARIGPRRRKPDRVAR